jgi:uncharacterized protein with HEPN domain
MLEACERVPDFTEGMDLDGFAADERTYHATLHNLALIGEAATHIPKSVRESYPDIPWRSIVGARNVIMHVYLGVDDNLIWVMVTRSVPDLIPQLRDLLEEAERRD